MINLQRILACTLILCGIFSDVRSKEITITNASSDTIILKPRFFASAKHAKTPGYTYYDEEQSAFSAAGTTMSFDSAGLKRCLPNNVPAKSVVKPNETWKLSIPENPSLECTYAGFELGFPNAQFPNGEIVTGAFEPKPGTHWKYTGASPRDFEEISPKTAHRVRNAP